MSIENEKKLIQIFIECLKVLLIFLNLLIIIICLIICLIIGILRAPVFEWLSSNFKNNNNLITVSVALLLMYSCNHLIAIYAITRYLIKLLIVSTIITTICVIIFVLNLSTNIFLIVFIQLILSIVYTILLKNDLHIRCVSQRLHNSVSVSQTYASNRNSVHFSDQLPQNFIQY